MTQVDVKNMTTEEIERYAAGFGAFLAQTLTSSNLSDDQKAAWATLVPEMTLDQLGRFATVLERYVDPTAQPEVADLKAKLVKVKEEYDAKIKSLDAAAQTEIASVMKEVEEIEAAAKTA